MKHSTDMLILTVTLLSIAAVTAAISYAVFTQAE